jgi:hypothetical protein
MDTCMHGRFDADCLTLKPDPNEKKSTLFCHNLAHRHGHFRL